ncbi:hypothetical protein JTB14_010359 [Gonioctena quinquepunctata]|nr:hypothetical protein JTB14_010359 [Gonioctena quinquepunctata]
MSYVHEILGELSFMGINNESSFGNSDTESNWDDDDVEYGVRVAVGGGVPPPIDEDIPVVDVDVEGAAVDNADADLDIVDEEISDEIPNTRRDMVFRASFLNPSRTTDPQSKLYCHTSAFVEVHTRNHVERLCLMCYFDYSVIVNNHESYAHVDMRTTAFLNTIDSWCCELVADHYINSD